METKPSILRIPGLFGSTFVVTGSNVSWTDITDKERIRINEELPALLQHLRPFFIRFNNLMCRMVDFVTPNPCDYSVYVGDESSRAVRAIKSPTASWGMRSQGEA